MGTIGPVDIIVTLIGVVAGLLVLVLFIGGRLFHAVGKIRRESRRADDLTRRLRGEWEQFSKTQSEALRQKLTDVDQRAASIEETTSGRIQEFERSVERTRKEVERLERYLRDVFEVELKNVFDSFDSTVSGVLREMKNELMRGIDRIEEIQSLIEGREALEGQIADGGEAVRGLTAGEIETTAAAGDAGEDLGEDEDTEVAPPGRSTAPPSEQEEEKEV